MCIFLCAYVYKCVCMCVCVHMCVFVNMCLCVCMYAYVFVCVHMYASTCVCGKRKEMERGRWGGGGGRRGRDKPTPVDKETFTAVLCRGNTLWFTVYRCWPWPLAYWQTVTSAHTKAKENSRSGRENINTIVCPSDTLSQTLCCRINHNNSRTSCHSPRWRLPSQWRQPTMASDFWE